MYVIEKHDGKQILTEEQIETRGGPLYRLLAIDDRPLALDQWRGGANCHQKCDRQSRFCTLMFVSHSACPDG
jgi:hypothetical protein